MMVKKRGCFDWVILVFDSGRPYLAEALAGTLSRLVAAAALGVIEGAPHMVDPFASLQALGNSLLRIFMKRRHKKHQQVEKPNE